VHITARNFDLKKIEGIRGDIQGDFTEWRQGPLVIPDSGADFAKKVQSARFPNAPYKQH
jgi:hypothetical protein